MHQSDGTQSFIYQPSVDILLATYNGERFLSEQLESIDQQTYRNWQILVSDDGSTDETMSIIDSARRNGMKIKNVSACVKKHSAALNFLYLLSCSQSEYVMFCDQDDVWLSQKVEEGMRRILSLEKCYGSRIPAMVFSDSQVVDESLRVICPSFMSLFGYDPNTVTLPQLLTSNVVQGCTMILNRALIDLVLSALYSAEFDYHDHWIASLAITFGNISYINEPLLLYRQHGGNEAGANANRSSMLTKMRNGFSRLLRERGDRLNQVVSRSFSFTRRANAILNCGITIPSEKKLLLEQLASFRSMSIYKRWLLIRATGIFIRTDIYSSVTQLLVWLFA